jgi:hypothetical protein
MVGLLSAGIHLLALCRWRAASFDRDGLRRHGVSLSEIGGLGRDKADSEYISVLEHRLNFLVINFVLRTC